MKNVTIKNGLRSGFRSGESKLAKRKCFGYKNGAFGKLEIDEEEAEIVRKIFGMYMAGNSLGKIAAKLEEEGIRSPTGRQKWNREAIDKMLSNEKYMGDVLLQKTISFSGVQFENKGFVEQYLYEHDHIAIISEEEFRAVQNEKRRRSKASA